MDNTLKKIQTQKASISKEIKSFETQIKDIQSLILERRKRISDLDKKINSLSKRDLIVSEHAIIRLLERRFFQKDIIEQAIDQIKEELRDVPVNCKLNLSDGLQAVIINNVLVTIKE